MSDSVIRTRNSSGQFLPGFSGNLHGRLPRQTEAKYLDVTMKTVSVEDWAEICQKALEDALDIEDPQVRARAREWLAKYLIGEPSQLHQLLYREERDIRIVVTFGDREMPVSLPDPSDIVEGEFSSAAVPDTDMVVQNANKHQSQKATS